MTNEEKLTLYEQIISVVFTNSHMLSVKRDRLYRYIKSHYPYLDINRNTKKDVLIQVLRDNVTPFSYLEAEREIGLGMFKRDLYEMFQGISHYRINKIINDNIKNILHRTVSASLMDRNIWAYSFDAAAIEQIVMLVKEYNEAEIVK